MSHRAAVLIACMGVLLASTVASATTYMMVADEDLVDGAGMIGVVRVLGAQSVRAAGRIVTDYQVEFVERFKGEGENRRLVVRRPGGMLPDGESLVLYGMPSPQPGEESLVFLIDNGDGTWGFEHLALGMFHVRTINGQRVVHRSTEAALALDLPGRAARRASLLQAHLPRDLETFAAWIRDRTAGDARPGDYYLPADTITHNQIDAFTLFDDGAGNNFHWHQFSPGLGASVPWVMDKKGIKGLKQKGASALKNVLKAWTKVFNIRMDYGGTASATAGFTGRDGFNAWLFGDPNGEIAGTFSCTTGGTLAVGGFQGATGPPHGATGSGNSRSYWDIVEGDVVFQNGIECVFPSVNKEKFVEEVGGHENGHSLGLAHSCGDGASGPCNTKKKNDALMRAFAHGDDRGAAIKADDKSGAKALDYGS